MFIQSYLYLFSFYLFLFLSLCLLTVGPTHRLNNVIVGLTNEQPPYVLNQFVNYTRCGQYPGAVPPGATVSLSCKPGLSPFKYLYVQSSIADDLNICRAQVLLSGEQKLYSWLNIIEVSNHRRRALTNTTQLCKRHFRQAVSVGLLVQRK